MAIRHTVRNFRDGTLKEVELTRGKAIKLFCLECQGGDVDGIRHCTAKYCPLYPFRPYQKSARKHIVGHSFEVKVANEERMNSIIPSEYSKSILGR